MTLATEDFSVVWVTLTFRNSGNAANDNAGRVAYFSLFSTYGLGTILSNSGVWAPTEEFVGAVSPSNYAGTITLSRDLLAKKVYAGSTEVESEGLRDDTSDPPFRDDDPQSGGSVGKVYDLDGPGIGVLDSPVGTIKRFRANFREYAAIGTQRVSDYMNWYSRVSAKKTSNGSALDVTVSGDNAANTGTTNLSWNLQ